MATPKEQPTREMQTRTAKSLPHLLLPTLANSADCLTRWFTPFLTNEQRAKTRAALNIFIEPKGLGSQLQARLQSKVDEDNDNHWLNDYWTNRFLAKRSPIAINDNYFCLFRHGEVRPYQARCGTHCGRVEL